MRHYKNWLEEFIQFASYGEAPARMYKWVGVSTIAGALRRRVWIDQRYFQWTPCFYIILVAPPGVVSKSTTASIGVNLLKKVPGISMGPDVVTWQKLIEDLAASREMVYEPESGLWHPMSCLTISSSEFGNLLNPQDRDMIDVLVSLWDGQKGSFTKSTKTSGNDMIENPWINIIACTTPDWIAGNFPEYLIGGGFTSRCIFVYADKKARLVAYPGMGARDHFDERKEKLIADLEHIAQLFGEYTLTKEAVEWGTKWYADHWAKKHNLPVEQFGGYIARKQTHIHKLAMVLAAAESDELLILPEHLARADMMTTELEADVAQVFARIGSTPLTRAVQQFITLIQTHRKLTKAEALTRMGNVITSKDFEEVITTAVGMGKVKLVTTSRGGELHAV